MMTSQLDLRPVTHKPVQVSLVFKKIASIRPILAKNECKILVDIKMSLLYARGTHFDV